MHQVFRHIQKKETLSARVEFHGFKRPKRAGVSIVLQELDAKFPGSEWVTSAA